MPDKTVLRVVPDIIIRIWLIPIARIASSPAENCLKKGTGKLSRRIQTAACRELSIFPSSRIVAKDRVSWKNMPASAAAPSIRKICRSAPFSFRYNAVKAMPVARGTAVLEILQKCHQRNDQDPFPAV